MNCPALKGVPCLDPERTEECGPVGKAICLLNRVENLVKEKVTLMDSMMLFFDFLPLPAFIKDLNGRIISLNSAYKSVYPVSTVCKDELTIGFPPIILNQYSVNDLWVQKYKTARVFEEPTPVQGQPNRVSKFLKFPVFSTSGELVGVAGLELSTIEENK